MSIADIRTCPRKAYLRTAVDSGVIKAGILRGIVADYEKAVKLISDNGYTVKLTDVLAVSVPDHPGGLAEVLETLSGHDIVVEYLYSFVRNAGDHALIIFRVDKLDEAEKVLTEAGVRLLSQDEVRGL